MRRKEEEEEEEEEEEGVGMHRTIGKATHIDACNRGQ